jgi:hypothetical protein
VTFLRGLTKTLRAFPRKLSKAGKELDPEKVEVILNLEPPTTVKGIQRALGHFGWYRDIMADYATAAIPLTNLTRKEVKFE